MAADVATTIRRAAVEMAAGAGAAAAVAAGHPVLAAGCVATGAVFFLARRTAFRSRPAAAAARPPAGVQPAAEESAAREALVRAIQDRIDELSGHPGPLSLVIVTPSLPIAVTASVRAASVEHIGSVIERVTRPTDFWGALGDGRFAVLLGQCDQSQAAACAGRLAVAIANRPLIAAGARVVVGVTAVPSAFDPGQAADAASFLAEAERRADHERLPVHRLVADTRLLRQRLVSEDYVARAA